MQPAHNRESVVVALPARAILMVALAGAAIGLASPAAFSRPQGERVVRGNVQISRNGDTTIIRAGDKSIINYRAFDIAKGETVQFIQPGAKSRVLNRIDSASPTRIDGSLLANGQVYLVNPAGVFFGAGSIVDVAGIYAGAGAISDQDFLRNINHFTDVSGTVVNDGSINAKVVQLIGQHVANNGAIIADHGVVSMVSGQDVLIGERGGQIYVRVDGAALDPSARPAAGSSAGSVPQSAAPGVENTGSVSAPHGRISLGAGDAFSLAIRNSGAISAPGGSISLIAADSAVTNTGSLSTSVDRGTAGRVTVHAPVVSQEGAATADAREGKAGRVEITSDRSTTLAAGSTTSASGGEGVADGGSILVHAYHGDTMLAPGATLNISGGAAGGDGGTAEISAGAHLGVLGSIKGDAKLAYKPASILFDPFDIVISDGVSAEDPEIADGAVGAGEHPGDTFHISTGAIESFAGNVSLAATNDIFVGNTINKSNGGLSLTAGHDIYFSGEFGGKIPDVTVAANFLNLRAGLDIVDRNLFGTKLVSSVGDINVEASGGHFEFGLATVASGRTLSLTQHNNLFIGAGPFGIVGNRENTNLAVNVTAGWLVFGGDFGGVSGELPGNEQRFRSINANARDFIRVDDNIITSGPTNLQSSGDVLIDGYIHSGPSIDIHAGADGSGQVRFLSAGLDLASDSIALRAGNNSGLGSASVDALTNTPTFRGAGLGASRPSFFTLQQDAAIGNAFTPLASQFGAAIAGMNYRLESSDLGVSVTDPSKVAGSRLTLASETGSTIGADLSLISLLVIGTAAIGGDVATTGDQTYSGAATLTDNDLFTGGSVHFASTLNGPFDAAIVGPVTFAQAVGGIAPLHSVSVLGPAALSGGAITTTGGQTYLGPVILGADTAVTSLIDGRLRFESTIDGAHNLSITTTPLGFILLGGDVGASAALGDLRLSTAGASPSRSIPILASIIGERSLTFNVHDFTMGQNEKFTTLGSLHVNASHAANIGDLVTQDDMLITAPTITLLQRPASTLLDSSGALVEDRGLDFVSGGVIEFNGDIVLGGVSATLPTFSSAASGVAPGNLSRFDFTLIDRAFVSTQRLTFDGQTLDQRSLPRVIPPTPPTDDVSTDLAGAQPINPEFEDSVQPGVYNIALLQRAAIAARGPRTDESVAYVDGRALYSDIPSAPGLTDADIQSIATRFNVNDVIALVSTYNALFGVGDDSQTERIAGAIADAGRSYMTLNQAARIDPTGFRSYLETSPDQRLALQYVQDLERILTGLRGLGLTPVEYRQTRDRLLATIPQGQLTTQEFARVVEAPPVRQSGGKGF